MISPAIYTCDYLNIFSDFREVKYKKDKIDFHTVKYTNKENDTLDFFEIFFTKYIQYAKIDISSTFLFVLKKLSNYESILIKVLSIYRHINIRFIIIETKYEEIILEKNKDDFLCQYIVCFLLQNNKSCILISNDKYRDLKKYNNRFNDVSYRILCLDNQKGGLFNNVIAIKIRHDILLNTANYQRCTIPKNKLHNIL